MVLSDHVNDVSVNFLKLYVIMQLCKTIYMYLGKGRIS